MRAVPTKESSRSASRYILFRIPCVTTPANVTDCPKVRTIESYGVPKRESLLEVLQTNTLLMSGR